MASRASLPSASQVWIGRPFVLYRCKARRTADARVVLAPGALCALSAPLYIFLFGISTLLSHMRAMGVLFNEHEFFIP